MANHFASSAFQPTSAPSKFVFHRRNVPAYQRRPFPTTWPRCLPSSARLLSMTTSVNPNKRTVSDAVRHANTVIVGGGPTGLLAAILMAHRDIPVTVVEQDDDLSRFDPLKAYALTVSVHGLGALRQLPSLMQHVKESGVPKAPDQKLRQVSLSSDGTLQELERRFQGPDFRIFHTRVSLVEVLQSYAKRFPNITLLKQTRVTDVHYNDSGEMDVCLSCSEKQYSIRTRLLLGCDGKSSIVSTSLRRTATDNGDVLRSSQGLGEDSRPTPTTGKLVKSITINEDFVTNKFASEEDIVDDEAVSVYRLSASKTASKDKAFWLAMFPISNAMCTRCGGRIATTVQAAEHGLWSVKTVDEGYALFDEVLPQLDARTYITADNMKKFVEAKALRLPNSRCLDSLVVHVGRGTPSGGVVFLGDAAHSFPPDVGQGLNAAFEDVEVFANVLDSLDSDSTIADVVEQYEVERAKDVKALLEFVRRTIGFVTKRRPGAQIAAVVNSKLRSELSKRLPQWFSPGMVELLFGGHSYSEMIRLYDETTMRLWACGVSASVLGVIAVFALLSH